MQERKESTSNTELVQRCRRGEAAAWRQLVQRYAALVHSIPVRYGLTPPEVDDIGQEVFLALAQGLHQLEEPERLPAWLITTTRRLTWRAIQKSKLEQPAADGDLADTLAAQQAKILTRTVPTISEVVAGWQRQEVIQQGLQRLGERCRVLLYLIFLDPTEPSYDDVSARLDIPKGSIGPTRNRCLQRLRAILEGLGFDALD